MNPKRAFREYLRQKFTEQYYGLDDDMAEAESVWFAELDVEDVINWIDDWEKEET